MPVPYADRIPRIPEMIETRQKSVGVFPIYSFVECGYDLKMADEVFLNPTMQELEKFGADSITL